MSKILIIILLVILLMQAWVRFCLLIIGVVDNLISVDVGKILIISVVTVHLKKIWGGGGRVYPCFGQM